MTSINESYRSAILVVVFLVGIFLGSFYSVDDSAINNDQNFFAEPNGSPIITSLNKTIGNQTEDKEVSYKHPLCIFSKVKSLSEFNSCNFVEWIEYHLLMGVSHFYINNDCSPEPSFSKALEYYKQLGVLTVPNENVTVDCANHKPNENSLLNNAYKSYSKQCEWVSVLDMDEFITLHDKAAYVSGDFPKAVARLDYHKVISTLPELLAASQFPFVRMPWWVIGSDGHEKRPKGLMLTNYRRGGLFRDHIKSIAKTSEIHEWWFQLYPFPKNQSGVLFGNITRLEYVQMGHLQSHEYITSSVNNGTQTLYLPLADIFIKHYVYQSWEEYSSQRGAYNMSAGGGKNMWKDSARTKWDKGYNEEKQNIIAEHFTSEMAGKVLNIIKQRIIHTKIVKNNVFETCSKYWF